MTHSIPAPTRAAAFQQLEAFLPRAGKHYASNRNIDRGAGHHTSVSTLSPYLRHRLLLEQEVLSKVRAAHSFSAAEKFISEVFWRTYFKGNLERRPSIWRAYRRELDRQRIAADRDGALAADLAAAEAGNTGIDAFDAWAQELTRTGYLHNHARMWFASIWIFTLRLPWEWGADFFLRHLMDGDPASNTLSWRWVGGLHTKGKTYLARRDNIARYTKGRFSPDGLAAYANPLDEDENHPLLPAPAPTPLPQSPALILITEDDCAPETLDLTIAGATAANLTANRSDLPVAEAAIAFSHGALADALERASHGTGGSVHGAIEPEAVADAAAAASTRTVVVIAPPVGPGADAIATAKPLLENLGLEVVLVRRTEDTAAWPHADKGFFKMKKAIPKLMP